jgi:MFS family permease
MAGLVIGALFILPFLLFSATSGQLADKYDKAVLIRFVKSLEIAIMLLAGWGFMQQHVPVLLGCVFLMGLHSTLFGPVKFAYLPQHLRARADRRQRHGGDGHLRGHPAGQRGRRAADRDARGGAQLRGRACVALACWAACWRSGCRCRRPPTPG